MAEKLHIVEDDPRLMTLAEKSKLAGISNGATVTSVSATGTSVDEVRYITINGIEKKLSGGGIDIRYDAEVGLYYFDTESTGVIQYDAEEGLYYFTV